MTTMTNEQMKIMKNIFESDKKVTNDMVLKALERIFCEEPTDDKDPCENCNYVEGSEMCIKYCPYDAERKAEPYESQVMAFPKTWEEYEQLYGFMDTDEIYTNGIRLIPSFRVKQWFEHQEQNLTHECGMVNKELLEAAQKFYEIHKDCVINDVPIKEYLKIGLKVLEHECHYSNHTK